MISEGKNVIECMTSFRTKMPQKWLLKPFLRQLCPAGSGTRTRTPFQTTDFESVSSAIPTCRRWR